jgi:hypothetical protein
MSATATAAGATAAAAIFAVSVFAPTTLPVNGGSRGLLLPVVLQLLARFGGSCGCSRRIRLLAKPIVCCKAGAARGGKGCKLPCKPLRVLKYEGCCRRLQTCDHAGQWCAGCTAASPPQWLPVCHSSRSRGRSRPLCGFCKERLACC